MVLAGSNRQTAGQLKATFKLHKVNRIDGHFGKLMETHRPGAPSSESYKLNVANKVLVSKDMIVNAQYRNTIENSYTPSVDEIDFGKDGAKISSDVKRHFKNAIFSNGNIAAALAIVLLIDVPLSI